MRMTKTQELQKKNKNKARVYAMLRCVFFVPSPISIYNFPFFMKLTQN